MGLLALVMAVCAPSLARTFRYRHLEHEAARFVALTEFARSLAIARGIPMVVWVDPAGRKLGVRPQSGYPADEGMARTYAHHGDLDLVLDRPPELRQGTVEVAFLAPDGSVGENSLESLAVHGPSGAHLAIRLSSEGNYEIQHNARD
jgi:Tfp pilus assembly protein FimT